MKLSSIVRATLLSAAVLASVTVAHDDCDPGFEPTPATSVPPESDTPAPVAPTDAPATDASTDGPAEAPEVNDTEDDATGEKQPPATSEQSNDDAPAVANDFDVGGAAPSEDGYEPTSEPTDAPAQSNAGAAQSSAGKIARAFSYQGDSAGGPGSYKMVTDVATCAKEDHQTNGNISPLDDDQTVAFRGPMTIYNIAVFDGSSGEWTKVSSFDKEGSTENMVFLNNNNINYRGAGSPEGFAAPDGCKLADAPTQFGGWLEAATDPNGFLPYETTGAEVHIMTADKCGQGAHCPGYYDPDGTAYSGWGGSKKMFVTKVDMPEGAAPNVPAIWMLNGQVVRSNQYACNCRGMGPNGGCGELDIAEVIERDTSKVATHFYFYEGNNAGIDTFGKRPYDAPVTYITIIDEEYGVKVLEVGGDDFDFSASTIDASVVEEWLQAEDVTA